MAKSVHELDRSFNQSDNDHMTPTRRSSVGCFVSNTHRKDRTYSALRGESSVKTSRCASAMKPTRAAGQPNTFRQKTQSKFAFDMIHGQRDSNRDIYE